MAELLERPDVLNPNEVELCCSALEPTTFEELGTLRWLEKHDRVEKLTMQATIQALTNKEETVKDMMITLEKLPAIVHDMVLIEVWREMLLPVLLKEPIACGISVHAVLHHEATCLSLIETVLYHPDAVETLNDSILDILDYASHALNCLLAADENQIRPDDLKQSAKSSGPNEPTAALQEQIDSLKFRIAFKTLGCLRYVIEQIDRVPGEVIPRLVVNTDTPMLLVSLMLQKPWLRHGPQCQEEYNPEEQRWIPKTDFLELSKLEGQVWIAMHQLLLNERVMRMYDLTDFRRSQLLRVRPFLHGTLLDQLSILVQLQQWLDHLAIGVSNSSAPAKSPLIIEMMSATRPRLANYAKKNKAELLKIYQQEFVNPPKDLIVTKARRLSTTYNFEHLEAVLPPSKCALCGNEATKRCSRCKNEWYCGRKCQVEHWERHKKNCDLVVH